MRLAIRNMEYCPVQDNPGGGGRERAEKTTQVEAVAIASSIPREIGLARDPENAHGLDNATVTTDHHIFTFVGPASACLGVGIRTCT